MYLLRKDTTQEHIMVYINYDVKLYFSRVGLLLRTWYGTYGINSFPGECNVCVYSTKNENNTIIPVGVKYV